MVVYQRDGWQRYADGHVEPITCSALAWQPNGRHLYVAGHKAGDPATAWLRLLETNGLEHGDTALQGRGTAQSMVWHLDICEQPSRVQVI